MRLLICIFRCLRMFMKAHLSLRDVLRAATVSVALTGGVSQVIAQTGAQQASFNPDFLQGPASHRVDISRFERGNPVAPGSYLLDVYVNQSWIGRQDIRVQDAPGGRASRYCFKHNQLASLGLDVARVSDAAALEVDCVDVTQQLPGALAELDLATLRLDLSIPQAFLNIPRRGYVDPREWDRGVTAGFVDYNANAYRNEGGGQESTQYYTGLNVGLNLGYWRLRHNGSYSQSSSSGPTASHYEAVSSYAQRDLTGLKSQLTLGEYFTPSDLFDSVPYTGVQLSSDDRMLPDSQRGFAPAIRGTAESNARVTVRQGGTLLYETSVAPGPFVIDDLYNTGYSGDLNVAVTEADGRVRSFTVPFASVAQLLRPGTSRYSLTAGKYRDDWLKNKPRFAQATYQRGISNKWTGYIGGIFADQYLAVQGGVALSTSLGAFAFDTTHSRALGLQERGGLNSSAKGLSSRLSYSKLLESTRTNFVVSAYRFSSEGYLSFGDFARARDPSATPARRQRNRFQMNINQPLANGYGSIFISGSSQSYWQAGQSRDTNYQAGYSNSYRWGSMSLSASRAESNRGRKNTQYMLMLSFPLGRSSRAPYLSSSSTYSDKGDLNNQLSVSGSLGEFNQFNYGVYGSRSRADGDISNSGGVNVQYRAASSNLSGSYSEGDGYRQIGFGLSGSVVAHPAGITFSQSQGETRAIVEAKNAKGARLLNNNGAQLGGSGYGVVASLMPYRQNEVALDPKGIADDVELQLTSQSIAPRYGAVVLLSYPTVTGEPVLLTLHNEQRQALPVGAEVLDAKGNSLTLVGQGSRVFFRATEQQGQLTVRWGQSSDRQCLVRYSLPSLERKRESPFIKAEALCGKSTEAPQQAAAITR